MTLEDKAKEWFAMTDGTTYEQHCLDFYSRHQEYLGPIWSLIDMRSFTNYLLYEAINELTKTLSVSEECGKKHELASTRELFVFRTCVSCGKDYFQKDMICVAIRAEYWCMSCASIALELCKPENHKEKNDA